MQLKSEFSTALTRTMASDYWQCPAFRPSGVMNSDVSEVTETDENILIPNARDAPRLIR
jgi:hypothetical protein